jgi:hypothetical protein
MKFFNTPKRINSLIKDAIVQCSPMSIGKIGIVESVNLDSYESYLLLTARYLL